MFLIHVHSNHKQNTLSLVICHTDNWESESCTASGEKDPEDGLLQNYKLQQTHF